VLAATEPQVERVLEHIRALSSDIGPRAAGPAGEAAARDYIAAELASYGYEVTTPSFPFDSSVFLPARVDAGALREPALAFRGSPAGIVEGPLVDAGGGAAEDFPAGGLNGAIAFIERGGLTFSQKVANAVAAGAGAVVIYNNQAGAMTGDVESTVPVAGLRQAQGQQVREALAAGQVQARVEVTPPAGTAYNVVARPAGAPACETVTGGHYDSVPVAPGADDNASGTATVIEVARVMAARGATAGNCFVLFGAEEIGLLGSAAYIESLSDVEINALRFMLNIDVVGITSELMLIGDDDLAEVARIASMELGVDARPAEDPPNQGSDHLSFQRAGVPVLMFNRDDELIHTSLDAIDRIDEGALDDAVRLAVATLEELAG
jgi:Iap family predicted aminopeptidase